MKLKYVFFLFRHVLLYSTNKICELILTLGLVVKRVLLFLGNGILRCQLFHFLSYCWIFGNTEVRFYFLKLWYRFNGLCFRFVPRFMLSDNRSRFWYLCNNWSANASVLWRKTLWVSIFDRSILFRGSCKSNILLIVNFWLDSGEYDKLF